MADPAPGPLHLVQSLASTLSADPQSTDPQSTDPQSTDPQSTEPQSTEPQADLLSTREEAAAWLRAAGLLAAEQAGLSNSEHAALLRLRESVREVLAAHTDGRQDAAATARLTKALAEGRLVVIVDPDSTVRLASAARASYPGIVAAFAVAIAESATAGTWPRLKSCPAPGCGQAFYAESAAADAGRCPAHGAAPVRRPGGKSGGA